MNKSMEGKVALITGGSMGIGKAAALLFAQEGAQVIIGDIAAEEGEKTVDEIRQLGSRAVFVQANVAEGNDVEKLVRTAEETFGRLDYAFNNVGINGEAGLTADCTEENFDRVIAVNLKSVWLCMKYEIPLMLKSGGGSIVNTASVAGIIAGPGLPAYSASKGGIVQLTRTAAIEYAKKTGGIRVNAVCPSLTRTPLGERVYNAQPELEQQRLDKHPMGRMVEPSEVGEAVVWLCSEKASFVTGHIMPIDGGFSVQ